jgi:coiled-coil domain-containing protein 55
MKAAARRQIEFEKMQDRKYSKEREGEGDLWSDKEVFVTSAYRKRMEERLKIEEEEKNQDMIDNLLDVKKQKDLSGFYTSMLKIRTGEMVLEEESQKEKRLKEEDTKFKETQQKHNQKSFRTKNREDSSSEEEEEMEKEELPNIEENQEKIIEENIKNDEINEPLSKKPKSEELTADVEKDKQTQNEIKLVEEKKQPMLSKEEEKRIRREKIFTKRTVGDRFDAELAEFFQRKSQYLSLKSYIERE